MAEKKEKVLREKFVFPDLHRLKPKTDAMAERPPEAPVPKRGVEVSNKVDKNGTLVKGINDNTSYYFLGFCSLLLFSPSLLFFLSVIAACVSPHLSRHTSHTGLSTRRLSRPPASTSTPGRPADASHVLLQTLQSAAWAEPSPTLSRRTLRAAPPRVTATRHASRVAHSRHRDDKIT